MSDIKESLSSCFDWITAGEVCFLGVAKVIVIIIMLTNSLQVF